MIQRESESQQRENVTTSIIKILSKGRTINNIQHSWVLVCENEGYGGNKEWIEYTNYGIISVTGISLFTDQRNVCAYSQVHARKITNFTTWILAGVYD